MIPKIIHYCWFGGNKKSKLFKKCYNSWKKYCPDYEIIEWNENNFDFKSCPTYVKEAYEAQKWAFVSDYVRLWALFNYGGVYLDTDVEILKNIDAFLNHSAVTCFEGQESLCMAVFGCQKEFPIIKTILEAYTSRQFRLDDGTYDLMTINEFVTKIIVNEYKLVLNNKCQLFDDDLAVYSNDYFSPKDYVSGVVNLTDNTHAIHWFNASWYSKKEKRKYKIRILRHRLIRVADRIIPDKILKLLLGEYLYGIFKQKAKI